MSRVLGRLDVNEAGLRERIVVFHAHVDERRGLGRGDRWLGVRLGLILLSLSLGLWLPVDKGVFGLLL